MWSVWIDTGGTFTDGIVTDPAGKQWDLKVLSNGSLRGQLLRAGGDGVYRINTNWSLSRNIFSGYRFRILPGGDWCKVLRFNPQSQEIQIDKELSPNLKFPFSFELTAEEEAPVLLCRLATETALTEELPEIRLKLGTTKGTNALLERRGANVSFLTTEGLGDVLRIGTQQRPELFALNIKQPQPFYEEVIEVKERLDASGKVLEPLKEDEIDRIVAHIKQSKPEAVALSLLHSFRNPEHEALLAGRLEAEGIPMVSASARIWPSAQLVPRAMATVINAYLDPVLNAYLQKIRQTLKRSTIHVMTSAGGLARHDSFLAKDSLLSGPAGGVVGAVEIGRQSGFHQLITFDMGGTSTDVAQYNGLPDYRFETKVGDALLSGPGLAIETVAAGGGSKCYFDGYQLKVGPESAGAFPGPACYGAGGPLTITDVNLLLGRLAPEFFGIPIDENAAREKLKAVALEVKQNGSLNPSPEALLQGFLDIANQKMVEAIRKISISRGLDPTETAMVAFGGAGGQHACQLAEALGVKNILVPARSGILSAYGIGHAPVQKIIPRSVLQPLDELNDLSYLWADLEKEGFRAMREEGIEANECRVVSQKLYLRYSGQDSTLELDWENGKELAQRFIQAYHKEFGYSPQHKPIELESIKQMIAAQQSFPNQLETEVEAYYPEPEMVKESCFHQKWQKCPIFRSDALTPGAQIPGPAMVISPFNTLIVEPGWEFRLDVNHTGVLSLKNHQSEKLTNKEQPESVQLELFTNRFRSIAEDMGALLERTAFSVNIKERKDFSCAVLSANGELLVNAPHIPVHLGSLGECVRKVSEVIDWKEGDVIITNHPAFGGSHLPDITMIAPVFWEGKRIAFVANRAHHAEVGGLQPGSMPTNATKLTEEGVVIPPTILLRDGKARWKEVQQLFTVNNFPSRAPEENLADLRAALASLQLGGRRLQDLCRKYSIEKVHQQMELVFERSAAALKEVIKELPPSVSEQEFFDDGNKICVSVKLEENITFDFSGTSPVHPGNLNATPAIVRSAVMYVLRLLTGGELPLNEGLMRLVELRMPTCLLNPAFPDDPEHCPAVVGGNTEVSQRLVDTLLKALANVACSQGTMNNFVFGNKDFGYYETLGGGSGAGHGFHGASAVHQHMTNTRITDPETLEWRYPVRLHRFSLRKGSGGAGQWQGGDGMVREIEFLTETEVNLLTQHRKEGPYGSERALPGKPGAQFKLSLNGNWEAIPGWGTWTFKAGERIRIETPGGGGYGTSAQNAE